MQPADLPAAAHLFFLDKSRTECWQFILASHKHYRRGRLLDTGSLSGGAGCCQQRRKWLPHLQITGFLICFPGSLSTPWAPSTGDVCASTSFWKPFWGRKVEISFDTNINLDHLPGPKWIYFFWERTMREKLIVATKTLTPAAAGSPLQDAYLFSILCY